MARTYTGNLTNFTEPGGLIQNINDKLSGALGSTFLVAVFIILLILFSSRTGSMRQSFTGASVICLVLSYLLWLVQLVGILYFFMFLVATAGGIIWLYKPEY